MEILITNDDGIFADGIYALYNELRTKGNVTVVAPDSEKSAISHAITLSHPIHYSKIERNKRFFGYGVNGTPADCVKFACNILLTKKPDLIVSGINHGCNDGCSIFYSGTIAGAREGALMGIPAMAISVNTFEKPKFEAAATYAGKLADQILNSEMPKGTFLNVNVPNEDFKNISGLKVTKQGQIPIHGTYKEYKNPTDKKYYWLNGKLPEHKNDNSIDTYALNNNYVTVVPIQSDATDYPFLEKIQKWDA